MLLPRRLPRSCVCSDSILVAILFCAATLFAWRRPRSGTMVHAAWLLPYQRSSPIAYASPPLCRRQRPASGWAGPAGLPGQQDRRCTRMDWTAYGHVLSMRPSLLWTYAHVRSRMYAHGRACAASICAHAMCAHARVRAHGPEPRTAGIRVCTPMGRRSCITCRLVRSCKL
jgi:hypothetical protein